MLKKSFKYIIGSIIIVALIIYAGVIVYQNNVYREKIIKEALAYDQEVNEDGMAVDMTDNPYFMKKHPGLDYPRPVEITYYSSITKTTRNAYVLLPINYTEEKEYPVLYLLHGLGGSHKTWLNKDADIILYNLMQIYGMPETIVVLPNSEVSTLDGIDDMTIPERFKIYDNTEEELINCVMPYIEANFSVKTGRENTAIAGNSMGGRNTIISAFRHQDKFGYVGIFSPAYVVALEGQYRQLAVMEPEEIKIDEALGQFNFVLMCVGREDQICGENTYNLQDLFLEHGINHIFYDTEGRHENKVWQAALYNFGLNLFKEN